MRCLPRSFGVLLSVLTIVDLTSSRALAAQTGEANVDSNANRPDRTSDSTPLAEAALEKALHRYQNVRDLEVDLEV